MPYALMGGGVVAESGSNSIDLTVAVVLALIAAVPGIGGLILSIRKRNEIRHATATEFGTQMAQAAFRNMEEQLIRLTSEVAEFDLLRDQWDRDKAELLVRINELTAELARTNLYLQTLLYELDSHGIAPPEPPAGYTPPPGSHFRRNAS